MGLSTGQNFQSPQEILKFPAEVEGDVTKEVGSAPRNSSIRSQTEETFIGGHHGQATPELERGGKVGDGVGGVERAPERGGGGPPAGGQRKPGLSLERTLSGRRLPRVIVMGNNFHKI
mgnify:FL=1